MLAFVRPLRRQFTVNTSAVLLAAISQQVLAQQCSVQITSPQIGEHVRTERQVRGTAIVPSGDHVWVLTRKTGFRGWWPQGNGEAEIINKEWVVLAFLGRPGEIGDFEISAVVVDSATSLDLDRWVREAPAKNYAPLPTFPNPVVECDVRRITVQKVEN